MAIYTDLRPHTLACFTVVVVLSVTLSALMSIVVAVLGLLTFGDHVATDLMVNYDYSDPVVIVAMVMVAVKAIATYPILLFVLK